MRAAFCLLLAATAYSQPETAKSKMQLTSAQSLDWFNEARFGLFIHWGMYAVPARGEWVMNRERIPKSEYLEKYASQFTASQFKPDEWCSLAKKAGIKYMVLTTRHHDGFCLWNTKTTDYSVMNYGPKRDLVKEYVEAARKAGLKIGFYFSVADWTHPDYFSFERDWPSGFRSDAARERFVEYYQSQVKELMTNYGKIDILWWDGPVPEGKVQGQSINEKVLDMQPAILINDRNGGPFHYKTSEQKILAGGASESWEACFTLNENWGWHATDKDYKSAKDVLKKLITCAGSGGNLLLNVGPKPDGSLPKESIAIIKEAGEWLSRNNSFLPHSERSGFERLWNNSLLVTVKGEKLYLHFTAPPTENDFCYAELKSAAKRVYFLDGGRQVQFRQSGDRLYLLNIKKFMTDQLINTLVVETAGKPAPVKVR